MRKKTLRLGNGNIMNVTNECFENEKYVESEEDTLSSLQFNPIKEKEDLKNFFLKKEAYSKFVNGEKNYYFYWFTTYDKLELLVNKKTLKLGFPPKWYDHVDRNFIEAYSNEIEFGKKIYASCITTQKTSLMWQNYAFKENSVLIIFNGRKLLELLGEKILFYPVMYIPHLEKRKKQKILVPNKLLYPFIKRYSYQDEREWRIISTKQNLRFKTIKDLIESVSISDFAYEKKLLESKNQSEANYLLIEKQKERFKKKVEKLCEKISPQKRYLRNDWTFVNKSVIRNYCADLGDLS